jgi:SAM-dependent methyltransferase
LRCRACGHGFVENRPPLAELTRIYRGDPTHDPRTKIVSYENRPDCRPIIDGILARSPERGDSLDVGSGDGCFSFLLSRFGYRPFLIDLDPRAELAAAHVPGATFSSVLFEDYRAERPLSAIVMSQILEHSLDPLAWLKRAAKMLSANGVLAIALPNFAGPYRLFGRRDPFIIPPIHLNYFTPASLRAAMKNAGLVNLGMRSWSRVNTGHPTRKLSVGRRLLGHIWNAGSSVLNPTPFGIILVAYAKRA